MRVKNWMTSDVTTVNADDNADDAWKKITTHHIRQLPVLSDGQVVGVVSRGDLLRSFQSVKLGTSELTMRVNEVMTPDPLTVSPDMPFEEATARMHDARVGSLIIVENGELAGILTRSDLFRAIMEITGLMDADKRREFDDTHLGKCFDKLKDEPDGKYARSFMAYRDERDGNWHCLIRFSDHIDS